MSKKSTAAAIMTVAMLAMPVAETKATETADISVTASQNSITVAVSGFSGNVAIRGVQSE